MNSFANSTWIKVFSILVHVRLLNLLLLILALYLSAWKIFSNKPAHELLNDFFLHGLVVCSVMCVAAGYLINDFYDKEKDAIAKPIKTQIRNFIEESRFLNLYLLLIAVSLLISAWISRNVLLFFLFYHISIWAYCHKFSRWVFLNNLFHSVLTLYPFLGLMIYYRQFHLLIFLMGGYLMLLILIKEIAKDILTRGTDFIHNYHTLPELLGIFKTKWILLTLGLVLNFLAFIIVTFYPIGKMHYYFYLTPAYGISCGMIFLPYRLGLTAAWVFFASKGMILLGVASLVLL